MNRQFTETIIGSIFTLLVLNPHELAYIFITGLIGAVGAFFGSLLMKWIQNWILKMLKQFREKRRK